MYTAKLPCSSEVYLICTSACCLSKSVYLATLRFYSLVFPVFIVTIIFLYIFHLPVSCGCYIYSSHHTFIMCSVMWINRHSCFLLIFTLLLLLTSNTNTYTFCTVYCWVFLIVVFTWKHQLICSNLTVVHVAPPQNDLALLITKLSSCTPYLHCLILLSPLHHMHTSPCSHILFTPQSYHVASTESFSFTSYSTDQFEVTATLSYDECLCSRKSCNDNGNVLSSDEGTARFGGSGCYVIVMS